MMEFFAILLIMGIIGTAGVEFFWGGLPDKSILNYVDLFDCTLDSIMSQYRFEQIKRYFHINDNTQALPKDHIHHDRLFKVRPLITLLEGTFQKFYNP